MKVHILSKGQFKAKILPLIQELPNACFISILEPDDSIPFRPNSDSYLTSVFYDLESDMDNGAGHIYKAISEQQAKEIFEFIKANADKEECYIHCAAGVSRSGAVGSFIHEYFGGAYKDLLNKFPHILPNGRVSKLLRMYERLDNMNDLEIRF